MKHGTVVLRVALDNRLGIKLRQRERARAVVEEAGVEKIRRQAPGFGGEFTKLQHLLLKRKLQKILTEIRHKRLFGSDSEQ